jgi:hypothetical protein
MIKLQIDNTALKPFRNEIAHIKMLDGSLVEIVYDGNRWIGSNGGLVSDRHVIRSSMMTEMSRKLNQTA